MKKKLTYKLVIEFEESYTTIHYDRELTKRARELLTYREINKLRLKPGFKYELVWYQVTEQSEVEIDRKDYYGKYFYEIKVESKYGKPWSASFYSRYALPEKIESNNIIRKQIYNLLKNKTISYFDTYVIQISCEGVLLKDRLEYDPSADKRWSIYRESFVLLETKVKQMKSAQREFEEAIESLSTQFAGKQLTADFVKLLKPLIKRTNIVFKFVDPSGNVWNYGSYSNETRDMFDYAVNYGIRFIIEKVRLSFFNSTDYNTNYYQQVIDINLT